MSATPRGTAFSIAFNDGGGKSKPKAKPSGTFKFLRKDEGQRVHAAVEVAKEERTPKPQRNESASLRVAMAADMRRRQADPFATADVALPKKGPPPKVDEVREPEVFDDSARDEGTSSVDDEMPPEQAPPSRRTEPPNVKQRTMKPSQEMDVSSHVLDDEDEHDVETYEPPVAQYRKPQSHRLAGGRHQLMRRQLQEREDEFVPDAYWKERRMPSRTNNYFHRRPVEDEMPPVDEYEEELLRELEEERKSCAAEKKHYMRLKLQVEKERQRFEAYKDEVEVQLEQERDDMLRAVEDEKKALKKQQRLLDEQKRSMTANASSDRDTIKRLQHENEQLSDQLEHIQADLKDREKQHRVEVSRLKRDVATLTTRNNELLEMVRQSQVQKITKASFDDQSSSDSGDTNQAPYSTDDGYNGGHSEPNDFDHRKNVKKNSDHENDRERRLRAAREKRARGIEERLIQEERERAERLQAEQERIAKQQEEDALRREAAKKVHKDPEVVPRSAPTDGAEDQPTHNGSIPTMDELIADDEPAPAETFPNDAVVAKSDANENGKREHLYKSGKREIFYSNGARKVILPCGVVTLYFSNGHVKRTFPSGKSTYNYAEDQTTHTTLPNGDQIFEFHGMGQAERHHPDGTKKILYPDGSFKIMHPDQQTETWYPDGTIQYNAE